MAGLYILASVARSPLLVVDAPSLLFRAYYALPDSIKDGEGRPVNALLGSINIMLNEIAAHGPRAVVMAFGQDAADYRVELFPAYHADRRELEADEKSSGSSRLPPDLYAAFGGSRSASRDSRPTTCWAPTPMPSGRPAGAR